MGHNEPGETTYTKQGFGQHIEVGTVNGCRAVRGGGLGLGNWGGEISVNGEGGEKRLPTCFPTSS